MKFLCIHGIGNHLSDTQWQSLWTTALIGAVSKAGGTLTSNDVEFSMLDRTFDQYPLSAADWARATALLAKSGIIHGLGDQWESARGWLDTLGSRIRWTAGMVVQWTAEPALRKQLRDLVLADIRRFQPDVILGHSLGSLVGYDLLVDPATPDQFRNAYFVAIGSQIGNPAVRNVFGGRLVVPRVKRWFHFYNPLDHVLTAPVKIFDEPERYRQIVTQFDSPNDVSNHSAIQYIEHVQAREAWSVLSGRSRAPEAVVTAPPLASPPQEVKALIIGIDQYANPNNNLTGCVNDAFLVSSVLQESGFPAEQVRVLLNDRATTAEIRDRLEWLLGDVRPGDIRYLHYSGHGSQLPAYGDDETVDRLDECLCPHDFDFTPERAVVDNWFFELYSQLPYDSWFIATLDCCHSGGLTRAGTTRVRGLELPDDIRHRSLTWNSKLRRWEPRGLPEADPFTNRPECAGRDASLWRLGRAVQLRDLPDPEFDAIRTNLGHRGPFMPMLFEACQESELAEEYRDGNTPYGVFTYALMHALRGARDKQQGVSFADLLNRAMQLMRTLGFRQKPLLVGPSDRTSRLVPFELTSTQPAPGMPSISGPPAPIRPLTDVDQAVLKHRDTLLKRADVVNVRAGYRFKDGWITDERAVVITVRRKLPTGQVSRGELLPLTLPVTSAAGTVVQVPVDVAPASPVEQLLADRRTTEGLRDATTQYERALLGDIPPEEVATRAASARYQPPGAALRKKLETPIKQKMSITCHTSPGSSFSEFHAFLSTVKKRLIMGMYDLTAPHVVEALIDSLGKPRKFTLVLDPKVALSHGGGDNPKAGDLEETAVRDDFEDALGNRFEFAWAAVKLKGKTSGGLFTNAYHIKVAVADGETFWLSSGNLQSTNQPKDDLPLTPTNKDLNRFNREWHVIVKNKALAGIFDKYLQFDFDEAGKFQADTTERAFVPEYDLLVPRELIPTKVLKTFKPKVFSKSISVQPLLTPDNYAAHVLKLIRSAKKKLYFQNQYIHLGAEEVRPEPFNKLCTAIKEKVDEGLDVRIILRDLGDTRKMLEELQDFGITGKHIKLQSACHNKGILIDSKRMLVGSHNYSGAGTTTNRDASLIIDDAQVTAYYEAVFLYDWDNRAHKISSGERAMPIVVPRDVRNARALAPQFGPDVPLRRIPWTDYFED